jgi:hypothetical protein
VGHSTLARTWPALATLRRVAPVDKHPSTTPVQPKLGIGRSLTSKRWQSGTSIDVHGRVSKAGDPDVRRSLYEAASATERVNENETACTSNYPWECHSADCADSRSQISLPNGSNFFRHIMKLIAPRR